MNKYEKMLKIKEFLGHLFSWTQVETMKEFLISILNFFGLAWWVEIVTENPGCTYYFGPFLTAKEAHVEKEGFMEDLELEGAKGIAIKVKRYKPVSLTIDNESSDRFGKKASPTLSSQLS